MKAENVQNDSNSTARRARRLRVAGVLALLLGIGAAVVVYWLGMRSANLNGDVSMAGFNRAEQRQMGQLYGKMGLLIEQWGDDLKQPGTQAILTVAGSALIAALCFYFARLFDGDKEAEGENDLRHGG